MKKTNEDKILRSSLSTLLKRFSNTTDIVGHIEKEYSESVKGQVKLSLIDDNHVLKKARINEIRLNKMIASLSKKGFTSPIFVVSSNERYEVVYPRIVYIAAKKLDLEYVPITVLNVDELEMLLTLASILRESKNKNIIEMSYIFHRLQKKYNYTQKEIAEMMNMSRSAVTNIIRLHKIPNSILKDLSNDLISFGHVRAISTLNEDEMIFYEKQILEQKLSVRDIEQIVYEKKQNISLKNIEEEISKKNKCHTKILKKKIVLTFESENELETFIDKLK